MEVDRRDGVDERREFLDYDFQVVSHFQTVQIVNFSEIIHSKSSAKIEHSKERKKGPKKGQR